jgi:hypothetical protein
VLTATATAMVPAGTCVLTTLNATPEPAFAVLISGTVSDANPSNCVVNLSGVVNGGVSVNADGTFSAEMTATGAGQVTGVATDNMQQLTSSSVTTHVIVPPPEISSFSVIHNLDSTWTLRGTVIDGAPGALTAVFGGPSNAQNATAPVNSAGQFNVAVTITTTATTFTVTACVTDSWGQTSDVVSITCTNG